MRRRTLVQTLAGAHAVFLTAAQDAARRAGEDPWDVGTEADQLRDQKRMEGVPDEDVIVAAVNRVAERRRRSRAEEER